MRHFAPLAGPGATRIESHAVVSHVAGGTFDSWSPDIGTVVPCAEGVFGFQTDEYYWLDLGKPESVKRATET